MSETLYYALNLHFKHQCLNFHASSKSCIVFVLTEQWPASLDRNQTVMESIFQSWYLWSRRVYLEDPFPQLVSVACLQASSWFKLTPCICCNELNAHFVFLKRPLLLLLNRTTLRPVHDASLRNTQTRQPALYLSKKLQQYISLGCTLQESAGTPTGAYGRLFTPAAQWNHFPASSVCSCRPGEESAAAGRPGCSHTSLLSEECILSQHYRSSVRLKQTCSGAMGEFVFCCSWSSFNWA